MIPYIEVPSVYRWGAVLEKAPPAAGLEGHLLPVSACPDAWLSIARLGGQPLWSFDVAGLRWVDVYRALDSPIGELVTEWGMSQGLLRSRTLWRYWTFDSDDESWRYGLAESKSDAENELDLDEDDAPDGHQPVEPVEVMSGEPKLVSVVGRGMAGPTMDSRDAALALWAERHLDDSFAGLWWAEHYDPFGLSAPRAGMFRRCIGGQSAISPGDLGDDDEILAGVVEGLDLPLPQALRDPAELRLAG